MQREASRWFQTLCVPCLVLCLALVAQASGAHSFTGVYRILKATPQDDGNVKVQVSLRLFNYSGANVTGATISLVSSLVTLPGGPAFEWEKEQAPFTNVTLLFNPHLKKVVPALVGAFTIPAEEYAQWQLGAGPRFDIAYLNAAGEQQHHKIDMAPGL
ncbi:MAG: hypothetical protein WCF22_00035 [Candidatus Sulfotelmatobacter sp.]